MENGDSKSGKEWFGFFTKIGLTLGFSWYLFYIEMELHIVSRLDSIGH